MNKIIGAVFPIPHHIVERLLSKERDAFIKFGHFLHLSEGQKIQFYDSEIHAIVGEATIKEVVYVNPMTVWAKYGSRLALNKDEFNKYVSNSPLGPRNTESSAHAKKMTLCLLSDPKKYSNPKRPARKMNMIGHYLRG